MQKIASSIPFIAVAFAAVTATLFVSSLLQEKSHLVSITAPDSFLTNESFIRDLNRQLDLENPEAVFGYVFSHLPQEIIVYPTENYYYFTFAANGRVLWGSLHLPAYELERGGVLGFGYVDKGRDIHAIGRVGGNVDFRNGDRVRIEKVNDFAYGVTYGGKRVLFRLNQLSLEPPRRARLQATETLVMPTFDESGLGFFLIFNERMQRLYWVLNEEGVVPESFTDYGDNLVLGDRTGFGFYQDEANNRKLLIGVYGPNVLWNNWYDGPFDQLLDNYVTTGQVSVRRYLEAHDPSIAGQVDKYGNLGAGARVAIAPYRSYFFVSELLETIASCGAMAESDRFYVCLTTENHDALLQPPFP